MLFQLVSTRSLTGVTFISKFKICIIDKKYTKFVHFFKDLIFYQL
jgi:hypothetical protein